MSTDEQEALAAFEGSQRKRNMIAMAVAGLAVAGFLGLKLYQSHLRSEASKPIVIKTQLPLQKL